MNQITGLLLSSMLLTSLPLLAETTPAKLISETTPDYPFDYRRDEIEGWVQVSYVVDEQGQVNNALLHQSSGRPLFDQEALETVQQWRYEPATRDGKPVTQSFNAVQINFRLDNSNNYDNNEARDDVNKRFLSRFQKGMSAVEKGDLKEAAEKLNELRERDKRKWIESSYLWVLEGYYAEKSGDIIAAANAFSKVIDNGSQVLPRTVYIEVLKKAFTANIMSNNLATAVATWQHFSEFAPNHDALKRITPYYQQAAAYLQSEQPLEVVGVLPEQGLWHHSLTKNQINIATAGKTLDALHLRCAYQQKTFSDVNQQSISIADDWGKCTIYVEGTPATQFLLTES